MVGKEGKTREEKNFFKKIKKNSSQIEKNEVYYWGKRTECAIDSAGRVPPSHGGSQGFESPIAHQRQPTCTTCKIGCFSLVRNKGLERAEKMTIR